MIRNSLAVRANNSALGRKFRAQPERLQLDRVGIEEWAEYELMNIRANAVYSMAQDDEYFRHRSRDIRSGYKPRQRVKRSPRVAA